MLIIGLVFLHYGVFPNSSANPFQGLGIHEHRFATWLNSAILFFFFSAVPLLSMISGWLFFAFSPEDARLALRQRIYRRFTSLYLPLVVWNAAYLGALYVIFLANPNAAAFTNMNRLHMNFSSYGWWQYFNAIFAVSGEPLAFQFWFVRDLFVTTLVSPVLWLMLRHRPWAGAMLLCVIWLSGWNMAIFIRSDVPFFFYMGALVRQERIPLTLPLTVTVGLIVLYVTLAGLRALAPYVVVPVNGLEPFWLDAVTRLMRIIGVLGCWGVLYRWAQTDWGGRIGAYGGLAFFLHSAHWPLLGVVRVVIWRIIPGDDDFWMLVHYFASVSITIIIGLWCGIVLASIAPQVFAMMNGGRLLGQVKDQPEASQAPPEQTLSESEVPQVLVPQSR